MKWYTRKKVDICDKCHFAQDFRELGVELKRCPHCGYGQETITKICNNITMKLHYTDEKMWFDGKNGDTFQFTNFITDDNIYKWKIVLHTMKCCLEQLELNRRTQ